jgi:Tetratricopeptide repeat
MKSIKLLDKEGVDLLCLASVLAVAPIPINLIREVFEALGSTTGSAERSLKALDQTESLSLCENAGDNAVRVHTLISRIVRFQFRNDDHIEQLRNAAVRVLCGRLSVVGDVREHTRIANEVAHARILASISQADEEDAALAVLIARHDYERGEYSGARKLQEQVLEARARLLGKEHPNTLWTMNNLAATLYAQGNLAGARKLQEQVLEARARLRESARRYGRGPQA